jgi:hypothetical protein
MVLSQGERMRKKPRTYQEKIEDIHREFGREEFRCTAFPGLGIQTLWVAGNSRGTYSHRGWELARFPLFVVLVVEEKPL